MFEGRALTCDEYSGSLGPDRCSTNLSINGRVCLQVQFQLDVDMDK